tara:strand:- start:9 stop:524 length:516 start_codon:yes stop_codon:yes gene_type:complete
MPTNKKIQIVESLEESIKNSKGIYLTNYTGLDVSQMTELRNKFRDNGVDYKVTKNTLTRMAAKNAELIDVEDLLVGQIGIAYSYEDPSAPARVIKDFSKDNDELDVVGIVFEGRRFEGKEFKAIANLPSREDLYSKILSALSQPMTNFASTLNGAMSSLACALENLKQTKQ